MNNRAILKAVQSDKPLSPTRDWITLDVGLPSSGYDVLYHGPKGCVLSIHDYKTLEFFRQGKTPYHLSTISFDEHSKETISAENPVVMLVPLVPNKTKYANRFEGIKDMVIRKNLSDKNDWSLSWVYNSSDEHTIPQEVVDIIKEAACDAPEKVVRHFLHCQVISDSSLYALIRDNERALTELIRHEAMIVIKLRRANNAIWSENIFRAFLEASKRAEEEFETWRFCGGESEFRFSYDPFYHERARDLGKSEDTDYLSYPFLTFRDLAVRAVNGEFGESMREIAFKYVDSRLGSELRPSV